MADAVQKQLEKRLDELEDLRKRNLFSDDEIKEITRRRRAFEYALRRRQTRKSDYLKYIEYELNLEALRKKRKEARNLPVKISISDYSIVRHIHFLFNQALKKFKGDVALWKQYFDYCEAVKSNKLLARAFATSIQYHPRVVDLWIRAAKWEFEENADSRAARMLFQRGLRLNKLSQKMWLEYFRFELLSLEKIQKRRKVMGLADTDVVKRPSKRARKTGPAHEDDDEGGNADETDSSDSEFEEEGEQSVKLAELEEEKAESSKIDRFLQGDIPLLVFKSATAAIPDDAEFSMKFIEIFRLFRGTKEKRAVVYKSLFPGEFAMAMQAQRAFDDLGPEDEIVSSKGFVGQLTKCKKSFEAAIEKNPTTTMWEYYIKFLLQRMPEASPKVVTDVLDLLQAACEDCSKAHLGSVFVYDCWADCLLTRDQVGGAIKVLVEGAKITEDASLFLRASELAALNGATFEQLQEVVKTGIKSVNAEDSSLLWQHLLSLYVLYNCPVNSVEAIFQEAITSIPHSTEIMITYVTWSCSHIGIESARDVYDSALKGLYHASKLNFLRTCIQVECSQLNVDVARVTGLYDHAVSNYGATDSDLWVEYVVFMMKYRPNGAKNVYWKAMKALTDPQAFISTYSLLSSKPIS